MSTSPRKRVLPLPRPFRQGQLDGLCGPYAIINGLRSACSAAQIEARVSWPMLFRVLLEQLDARWRLADVVTEGIGTQEFRLCLSTAATYLKKRHGIHVTVSWPWKRRKSLQPAEAFTQLGKRLGEGCVLLLGYDGHHLAHWTVVVEANAKTLEVMDSSRRSTLEVSDFVFHLEGLLTGKQTYVLTQVSVALVSVRKA